MTNILFYRSSYPYHEAESREVIRANSAGNRLNWRNIAITLKMAGPGILSATAWFQQRSRSSLPKIM
jgi:hypothetical protein